jgi:hypothetical protein
MKATEVLAGRVSRETAEELRTMAEGRGVRVSEILRTRIEAPPSPPPPIAIPPTPREGEAAYLPSERCGRPLATKRERAADILRRGAGIHHPEDCVRGAIAPPSPSNGKRRW